VREDGRIVGGDGWQENVHKERNGRSSWERHGIVTFCACQWNEWMISITILHDEINGFFTTSGFHKYL
jgi:hypothetical protein